MKSFVICTLNNPSITFIETLPHTLTRKENIAYKNYFSMIKLYYTLEIKKLDKNNYNLTFVFLFITLCYCFVIITFSF